MRRNYTIKSFLIIRNVQPNKYTWLSWVATVINHLVSSKKIIIIYLIELHITLRLLTQINIQDFTPVIVSHFVSLRKKLQSFFLSYDT